MRLLLYLTIVLLSVSFCGGVFAQTFEKQGDRGYIVRTPVYEAKINSYFGFLESLVMGGVEVVENKYTAVIYGYYNVPGLVYIADSVEKDGNSIISSNAAAGSVEYVFEPEKVVIKVTNGGCDSFVFHTILSRNFVGAVSDTGWKYGIKGGLPAGSYTLLTRGGAVRVKGDAEIFDTSVLRALRFTNKKGTVASASIEPAAFDKALSDAAYALRYPESGDEDLFPITVNSPADWQVFQRTSKKAGYMRLSGKVNVPFDTVRYRISGKSANGEKYTDKWKPVRVSEKSFDEEIEARAGGWYKVELQALKDGKTAAKTEILHVGIGEVFVGAGQSNATNSSPDRSRQESGMVSCTDGKRWQPANDPMIGVHDGSSGGSFYPALGDLLYKEFGVPIGFASTGHGGTSVSQWSPGTELYGYFLDRVLQLGKGGFRAVLWHQGENDAWTPSEDYYRLLRTTIRYSCLDAG
ncbi:MAG: hypothetical protein ILO36_05565, partial [Abditibacteriota bacterium]|nr:hypothetical protein [Abditibacteriota bacterium]